MTVCFVKRVATVTVLDCRCWSAVLTLPPRIRTPARRLRPSGSSSPLKIQFMIY